MGMGEKDDLPMIRPLLIWLACEVVQLAGWLVQSAINPSCVKATKLIKTRRLTVLSVWSSSFRASSYLIRNYHIVGDFFSGITS